MKTMFNPRPPMEFKKPISKRRAVSLTGVADLVKLMEATPPPPPEVFETPRQKRARLTAAKRKSNEEAMLKDLDQWKPKENPKATGDAYKTLFVCKISYDTTEKKLRREFEQYGRIKSIRMVSDHDGKPRG
ncbi:unnamed protein product [Discosporangium mesarthrocarpum]